MLKTLVLTALLLAAASAGFAQSKQGPPPVQKQTEEAKLVDPVCGMQIDPAKAAGKSEYKGKTYYFCSDRCKKTFDANPEAVLKQGSKKM